MRKPPNERERLAYLRALNVLDPALVQHFEPVVRVASEISGCPIVFISFLENDKELIRAPLGLTLSEEIRTASICAETILSDEPLIINDLRNEPRFSSSELVRDPNNFLFYAGFPLISKDKVIIGALSVASRSRHALTPAQIRGLQMLASHTVSHIILNNKLAAVQRTLSSLEDSEQRFRRIADASPVLLWISDEAGHRTLSNKAWCDFTGISQEDSLAECWRDAVHPDDNAVYQAKWRECAQEQTRFQHEFRLRHQSGTYRWVMEQAIPLFSSNGRLEAYVSSCVDLSLRNSEELQYQHNEARFRAVSEAAPLGIVVTDSNGNCVYSNLKFQHLAGLSAEESLGSGWLRSIHPDDRAEMDQAWSQATKTVKSFERTFRYLRTDQSVAWCNLKAAAINSTDTVSGWVSTIEDITAQRQAEADLVAAKQAAEAATHAKSLFLANMSHEIRTPLTAIIGFADALLEESKLEPALAHCLEVIHNNGKHLLTIINQILDLSKMDAGALTIERNPCILVELIEEILSMFTPTVSEKCLYLRAEYVWPLPERITTDTLRVKQVLINLVGNAVKFTPTGGITIRVAWDGTAQHVCFSISDTGIGMSKLQVDRLFTPFYQANDSITRTFGGTGLGLSISQRLIKALGGSIEVTSSPGKGSTFSFHIQSKDVEGQTSAPHQTPALTTVPKERASAPTLTGKILFADDALDNRKLVDHLLRKTGVEVVLVENGQEAIDAATSTPFDLILMDIQMPVVDGLSATRLLRKAGITTPVIAISAGTLASDVERALDAGCCMHLSKPFERASFYDALIKFLRRRDDSRGADAPAPQKTTVVCEDPEMLELIVQFIQALPGRINEITKVAELADFTKVAALAHKLKGSAGMYGYPELASQATKLERAAKSTSPKDAVRECLRTIQDIVEGIRAGATSSLPV